MVVVVVRVGIFGMQIRVYTARPMRVIGPPLGRRRYRGRAKLAPDPIQSLSDQPDPFSIRQLFSMEEEEEEN